MADAIKAQNRAPRKLPSQAFLLECFIYDPLSGTLIWKRRPRSHFKSAMAWKLFNTKYAGRKAGSCKGSHRYFVVFISGLGSYLVHRVIWKMQTDKDPDQIDHIDLTRTNNRWKNLRESNQFDNMANLPVTPRNKLGFKQVYQVGKRFRAMISVKNRSVHIGYYDTPEEANAAYFEKAKELHGQFARAN